MDRRQFLQTTIATSGMLVDAAAFTPVEGLPPAPPAPGGSAIYISDLDRCLPTLALSRRPQRHRWRLLDYEAEDLKGVMLVAGENTNAPEIRCPLERQGWHAIYIGMRSIYGDSAIEVRLKGDTTFSVLKHRSTSMTWVDDVFWKVADLSGQELVFRQPLIRIVPEAPDSIGNPSSSAWIVYIKLVPLTEPEMAALEAERRDGRTRRLFAHNDAWSYHYGLRPTTAEEIRRQIEPYRDTDFSRIYWEAGGGDGCNYFTRIGLMPTGDCAGDPYRVGERLAAESWRILRRKGIDPFRVALEYAHEIGLEFHAAYRVAGFHSPPPHDDANIGRVYDRHPEWRGTDREGHRTPRLSYAYPECRGYVISLFKEMAGYPIDGICLLYNRRPPVVEYEPPIVDGFRAKYGKDPRELDEHDPQWLAYRATFLTQFMREVAEAMKEVAREQKRAKPFEISALVMSSQQQNLYYALDLEAWVKEGLVDTIIPESAQEVDFLLRITKGTGVKVAHRPDKRRIDPESSRTEAHRLYQAGVDHLFFWDTNNRHDYSASWSVLRRLGHRDELADWVRAGSPKLEQPGTNLQKVGDWDLLYKTPG